MTERSAIPSNVRRTAAVLICALSAACGFDEDWLAPANGTTGWAPASTGAASVVLPGATPPSARASPWPRERTIIGRDGGVTVIQRDRDGTRTIVGSHGVRVIPPDTSYRRRR